MGVDLGSHLKDSKATEPGHRQPLEVVEALTSGSFLRIVDTLAALPLSTESLEVLNARLVLPDCLSPCADAAAV